MDKKKALTVLITGTNKGLGLDLLKLFLKNNPKATIYATSRSDSKIAYQSLANLDENQQIRCKKLEICSKQSIQNFAEQIRSQNVKFDIIVNNIGVASVKDNQKEIPDLQFAKLAISTNTIGPMRLTKKLLPYLADQCRVVNVSSLLGALKFHPRHTQRRFSDPKLTQQDILLGANDYLKSAQSQKFDNWCRGAYITSKMLLNAWSRFILQKQWLTGDQKAICVAPGFCRTPMTKDFPDSPFSYTSQSGAFRIYQTIFLQKLSSQIFYHRARESDYFSCGQGLPYDPIQ